VGYPAFLSAVSSQWLVVYLMTLISIGVPSAVLSVLAAPDGVAARWFPGLLAAGEQVGLEVAHGGYDALAVGAVEHDLPFASEGDDPRAA
jgi:hypothetical protein